MRLQILLSFFVFILIQNPGHAQNHPNDEVSIIAKIRTTGGVLQVVRSVEGDVIPSLFLNKSIESQLGKLAPGDEAIVKGYITYQGSTALEGQISHHPIFMIESISPISLHKLGETEKFDRWEPKNSRLMIKPNGYQPEGFEVSPEVAAAITMTSGALMLHSLAADSRQPQVKQDLNSGMLLFSGIMFTGIFLYKQLIEK